MAGLAAETLQRYLLHTLEGICSEEGGLKLGPLGMTAVVVPGSSNHLKAAVSRRQA